MTAELQSRIMAARDERVNARVALCAAMAGVLVAKTEYAGSYAYTNRSWFVRI